MKKYEILTAETHPANKDLHRIRALRDIPMHGIKAGDLGGWIEDESNLSQEGECWVADNARAEFHSVVRDNALVKNNAWIYDSSTVEGNAVIKDNACVEEFSTVKDFAIIENNAVISYGTIIQDHARISGNSVVAIFSCVANHARVSGNAVIAHKIEALEHAEITGDACITEPTKIMGHTVLDGLGQPGYFRSGQRFCGGSFVVPFPLWSNTRNFFKLSSILGLTFYLQAF